MPDAELEPGDVCACLTRVCNPTNETYMNIPLFVILDIHDELYFAPSFDDMDWYLFDLEPGHFVVTVIPETIWPENAGSMDDVWWYAGMTDPAITELFGEMDRFRFEWRE